MGRNLTLSDALNLTTFAQEKGLKGVMTWTADNDAAGVDGNAPYAYSLGILSKIGSAVEDIQTRTVCGSLFLGMSSAHPERIHPDWEKMRWYMRMNTITESKNC